MTMHLLKLAPESVQKPWGLSRCPEQGTALGPYPVRDGTGELWLASAQTGPGNYSNTVVEPSLGTTLAEVLAQAQARGRGELLALLGQTALAALERTPHRGKTEAWIVREVKGHTGVASGPRTQEHLDRLRDMVVRRDLGPDVASWPPDVRELLGLIEPLCGGEVFLVPCGTLHTMFAIGADGRLVIEEIQQGYGAGLLPTLSKILMVQDSVLSVQVHPCDELVGRVAEGELKVDQNLEANPTVRVYDFGRRPGEYPELGFQLTDVRAGSRRVTPIQVRPSPDVTWEVLVACPQFVRARLSLAAGAASALAPRHGSYRVLHCTDGSCVLEGGVGQLTLDAAETVFVPGDLEGEVRVVARSDCSILDDAVPDLGSLRAFLASHGRQADALLDPPRASPELAQSE